MGRIRVNKAGVTAQEASLNAVGTKVSDISSQLESARVAVNRCIKSNNTIAIRIRAAQLRISNDSNNILQLRSALATINDKYSSCENKLFLVSNSNELFIAATNIADSLSHFINSDSIGLTPDWIENMPYTSIATLAGLSVSDSYEWILDKLTSGKSNISNIRDLSELGWLFTGNENLQEISKSFKEMGDNSVFKTAGYLDDGLDLIDAINNGDLDALESLADKYMKQGVKYLTGAKGATGAIYLDLGLNMGKNFAESAQAFTEDPSLSTAFDTVWSVSAGAFLDTGFGLAENTLDFVYGVFGADFDNEDFNEAMDFLSGALHDVTEAAVVTVVDTATEIVETIGSGVAAIGETVGSWFKKLF